MLSESIQKKSVNQKKERINDEDGGVKLKSLRAYIPVEEILATDFKVIMETSD